MDDNLGPIAISIKRERVEKSQNLTSNNLTSPMFRYRIVIRTSEVNDFKELIFLFYVDYKILVKLIPQLECLYLHISYIISHQVLL